jgi:hypothetical protein
VNSAQADAAVAPTEDTYVIGWPESPGNVWGVWTEAAALGAIRGQLARDNAAAASVAWSLVRLPADPDAAWQTVAEGEDLLALAAATGADAA